MIRTASSWTLSESAVYRRQPARRQHQRPPDFQALFDDRTVFYDCFRVSPGQVMLLAPPLLRFPGVLDSLKFETLPDGWDCRFECQHKFTSAFGNRHIHNLCRVLVDVPQDVVALRARCDAGSTVLTIHPNGREHFRGKRVLLTLSKNNDPVWICDWMRFHRDLQKADAVLLYDNGSTAYDLKLLLEAMQQVSGFSTVAVVAWPFKYGPQGIGRGTWDSAFCQDGAIEDARWRFLGDAFAVLSCDVDELTVTEGGSVFDLAATSAAGYVKFAGRWVTSSLPAMNGHAFQGQDEVPRHRDSTEQVLPKRQWKNFSLRDIHLSPPKWAAVPGRCPEHAHWSVHEIVGMEARTMKLEDIGYRHFHNISTGWKKTRATIDRSAGVRVATDTALQAAFAKVRWSE